MKLFLLFILPLTLAIERDITFYPNPINLSDNFSENLFTIENLDHETGTTDSILVNLTYNATTNSTFIQANSTHIINKFTKNTGGFNLSNTSYLLLCGKIQTNITDTNLSNNAACWEYTTLSQNTTINETNTSQNNIEDCTFEITDLPSISTSGETLEYKFEPWNEQEITYWIEDIYGNELKKPVTTSSNTKKRYTPKTENTQEGILIKATREECEAEHLILIQGEEQTFENSLEVLSTQPLAINLEKQEDKHEELTIAFENTQHTITFYNKGTYELDLDLPAPCSEDTITISFQDMQIQENIVSEECIEPSQKIITSFYTRAKKFQEEIILRGKLENASEAILITHNTTLNLSLEESFEIPTNPKPHNNTYALLVKNNQLWEGMILQFYLEAEETLLQENKSTQNISQENTTIPSFQGSYVYEPPQNPPNSISLVAAIPVAICAGALLLLYYKRKALRRKKNSLEPWLSKS